MSWTLSMFFERRRDEKWEEVPGKEIAVLWKCDPDELWTGWDEEPWPTRLWHYVAWKLATNFLPDDLCPSIAKRIEEWMIHKVEEAGDPVDVASDFLVSFHTVLVSEIRDAESRGFDGELSVLSSEEGAAISQFIRALESLGPSECVRVSWYWCADRKVQICRGVCSSGSAWLDRCKEMPGLTTRFWRCLNLRIGCGQFPPRIVRQRSKMGAEITV